MFGKFKNKVVDNVKNVCKVTSDSAKKAKNAVGEASKSSIDSAKKAAITTTGAVRNIVDIATIENAKKAGKTAYDAATIQNVQNTGQAAIQAVTLENVKTVANYASGVKGYKELKKAKNIKAKAQELLEKSEKELEENKVITNQHIQMFGEKKVDVIKNTVTVFLDYLKFLEQKNKGKELKMLEAIDIKREEIKEIIDLTIGTENLAKGVTGSLLIGATALFGTKAAVLGGVSALASASTGTSIATLTGAAKANAVLAWLGGGAVASGGGGVAAGTTVLAGITVGAMASAAFLSGGILLSAHGSKALTKATRYMSDVEIAAAEMKKMGIVLNGIQKRTDELRVLMIELKERSKAELIKLDAILNEFDNTNQTHKKIFQQNALIIKAIVEIANAPVIDQEGNVSEASGIVAAKVKTILKT